MIFKQFLPAEQLTSCIVRYELRHFIFDASKPKPFKPFPPSPYHYLNFFPRGYEQMEDPISGIISIKPTSELSGLYTHRINRFVSSEYMLLTAVFRPDALHYITDIPFDKFLNESLDMESVYPKDFKLVNEQLKNSDSYADMVNILDKFLIAFINKYSRPDKRQKLKIMDDILHQPSIYSIEKQASLSNLSLRQYERKFIEYTGVNPKTFLRIARFHESYTLKLAHPEYDWLRIAMACNYNDYQHLAKDYQSFTQVTPNQFLKVEMNSPGRILGLRQ